VKKRLPIVILIIILSVVYYLFGMDYLNQRKEQKALTPQIAEVTQTLGDMPEPSQNLEQQLEAAEASLVAEQSAFPGKMDTTQVIDTILRLADDCQVKAIPLITEPWSKENIGQHDYYVFRLNLAVGGSFSQLVNFVGELENGGFNTLIVENVSLTRLSQQSEDEGVDEETILITASLDLAIYAQPLNAD
jgi:hypothetical protein